MKNITKIQSDQYAIIACSFHEASHAVCGILNYFKITSTELSLPGSGNTEFICFQVEDDQELKKIASIFEMQMIYAGLIGEKIYYKDICGSEKFPMHLRIGSSVDLAAASEVVRKNKLSKPGKNTYIFKKQIQKDVEILLLDHWNAVKLIAHALYAKKKLSYQEIKNILCKKTTNKDFWTERFRLIKFIYGRTAMPSEEEIKDIVLGDAIFSV